jgi:pimeloyl-ACP methyl ester carboxylesterase
VTPPPPATGLKPTVVVFVTGGNMSAAQVAALQADISSYYRARLPAGTPWLILGYNSNITGAIESQYPGRQVVLIGHSFGGDAAVKAAATLDNPISLLMLLDPVHISTPSVAQNFTIPSTVQKAVTYRRQFVDGVPASGLIANPRAQDQNIIYPMDSNRRNDANYINEMHGWPVWQDGLIFPKITPAL